MGLKLMKSNGKVRPIWYGQYKEQGKWKVIRLTTPMRGERIPQSLSEQGDEAFERSRIRAQDEFDHFENERKTKGSAEHLTRALIASKTGQVPEDVRLIDLEAKWRQTHTRKRSSSWDKGISWMFGLFTKGDADKGVRPVKCTYLYEVTPTMVAAFYKDIRAVFAWSVVSRIMKLLCRAFANLLPDGSANPFSKVEVAADKKTDRVIHRKPLSEAELEALFKEAKKDPLAYALVTTAACTGMRIGDVCNLEWRSVDLNGGFIDVKTRKTGQEVTIPIFPRLLAVLKSARQTSDSRDKYVFPAAAALYAANYSGLIRMGKVLFARALFREQAEREAEAVDPGRKPMSPAKVLACIRDAKFSNGKKEKVERVYMLYMSGLTYRDIERETGCSRGQISGYLHEVEALTGKTIVKFSKDCATSTNNLLRKTRQERTVGSHAASIYGWHALRATFVVQALTNNIAIEIVRMVVGHADVDMTLEYFNPTKRIMADAMRKQMQGNILSEDGPIQMTEAARAEDVSIGHPALPAPADATGGKRRDLAAIISQMSAEERQQLKSLLNN